MGRKPGLDVSDLRTLVIDLLKQYGLYKQCCIGDYDIDIIAARVSQRQEIVEAACESSEMQVLLLKSACLEVVRDIKRNLNPSKEDNRRNFDQAIQYLFEPDNPEGIIYCASVTRQLYQFRLSKTYSAREIITEAYTRGIKNIEKGISINNPPAWLRRTCLNVIRDFKREQQRLDNPKLDQYPWCHSTVFSDLMKQEDILAIRIAFQKLSVDDQMILQKRVVEGFSWQEIADSMVSPDGQSPKVGTIRQRGARALKRLRQIFDEHREHVHMPNDLLGLKDC
ncbi:MAG: RNA polymerase sigma factor [Cyanobacteria bacterium P01_H01_bin.58]